MFHKILIGLDGSPGSFRALDEAAELARRYGASLDAVSVVERDPRFAATVGEVDEEREAEADFYRRAQERARTIAAEHGVDLNVSTLHGHAAQTLAEQTRREEFDLLVLGHSGRSAVWGLFLGTTADKVSRHASCSVLIVR